MVASLIYQGIGRVVEAIAAGDPVAAVRAMREHLDHVLPVLEVTRQLRPECFTTAASVRSSGR